jgi:hypothetical protein
LAILAFLLDVDKSVGVYEERLEITQLFV